MGAPSPDWGIRGEVSFTAAPQEQDLDIKTTRVMPLSEITGEIKTAAGTSPEFSFRIRKRGPGTQPSTDLLTDEAPIAVAVGRRIGVRLERIVRFDPAVEILSVYARDFNGGTLIVYTRGESGVYG